MQTRGGAAAATFVVVSLVLSSACATQFIAHTFAYQPALGGSITLGPLKLYAPWSILPWSARWTDAYPRAFAAAHIILTVGGGVSFLIVAAIARRRAALPSFGKEAWAKFADVEAAGLFARSGTVLGKFDNELLAFDGPEHQILLGASRSGKGRGHVVPTLLSWAGSAIVLDVKGELDAGDARHGFPGTSGFRATFGHVLRFAPTRAESDCFNVLLEVRRGANEVRDAQNIVDVIVEPHGETKGSEQFWNSVSKIVITGVIVHVLYVEPPERKTLAVVREKLRNLDKTAEEMRLTLHRRNPRTGEPETHPEVLHAAESYLAGEERLRSGIKATAESFFGMFADPIVAEKTARSDFRIGDLMCADKPVTLYLQPPPSDAQRLMPLMRLIISQIARSLMEDQTHDAQGRLKKHRLLMVLDEFPQLGRLDFFERMMGAMAGYGIKAYLVCQSLNHIIRAYGRDNVILDNCHVVTAFAAADPETAKRISDMAGEVWEIRPHESEHKPRPILGLRKGSITYREERRPLLLPAAVRALPRDEQLIFVSGMKPLKAKKLRFDREIVFARRLRPVAKSAAPLSQAHDWDNVVSLGKRAAERKALAATGAGRAARPLRPTPAPKTPQPDLFGEKSEQAPASAAPASSPLPLSVPTSPPAPPTPPSGAPSGPKVSELALAGFQNWPRPGDAAEEAPTEPKDDTPPKRAARSTGI